MKEKRETAEIICLYTGDRLDNTDFFDEDGEPLEADPDEYIFCEVILEGGCPDWLPELE